MTRVRDLFKENSRHGVLSIGPEALVVEAIRIFCENKMSSLVVLDQGVPVGFLNEKDVLLKALVDGLHDLRFSRVREAMTPDVLIGLLDDEVSWIFEMMNKKNMSNLPVIHQHEIIGFLTLNEIIEAQILDEQFENRMLHNYIEGNYPG